MSRNPRSTGVQRVMLDTNVFDRLLADPEAEAELENRRDLRPMVTGIQLAQLAAIPDAERRERYLSLAGRLCATLSAPASGSAGAPGVLARRNEADRHEPDRMIAAAAAARCDLLVSDDRGLLEYAKGAGISAMDWNSFVARILFKSG